MGAVGNDEGMASLIQREHGSSSPPPTSSSSRGFHRNSFGSGNAATVSSEMHKYSRIRDMYDADDDAGDKERRFLPAWLQDKLNTSPNTFSHGGGSSASEDWRL